MKILNGPLHPRNTATEGQQRLQELEAKLAQREKEEQEKGKQDQDAHSARVKELEAKLAKNANKDKAKTLAEQARVKELEAKLACPHSIVSDSICVIIPHLSSIYIYIRVLLHCV